MAPARRKRAILLVGLPHLARLAPLIPARGRGEDSGYRRVDEGFRVAEDPVRAEATAQLDAFEAGRGDGYALRLVRDRVLVKHQEPPVRGLRAS